MDQAMQMKIENMIAFKKSKDRKKYFNNPAVKETNLKSSKDNKVNLSTIT